MKTILITGINGFLGSSICYHLYKDYKVIGLDRSLSSNFRIKDIELEIESYHSDKIEIESVFFKYKIDIIIHTATNFGNDSNVLEVIETNINLPLELMLFGVKYKSMAFINTDTFYSPSYGNLKMYSLSKKQFLNWAEILSEQLKFVNLKIGVIFGPKDNRDKFTVTMITRMLKNDHEIKLTEGLQKRHFLYVEEAVRIFRILIDKIDKIDKNFSDFNIGSGVNTTIKDYLSIIHKLTLSKSYLNFGANQYRENENMDPDNDINDIKLLGWRPSITLEEALLQTINYEKMFL